MKLYFESAQPDRYEFIRDDVNVRNADKYMRFKDVTSYIEEDVGKVMLYVTQEDDPDETLCKILLEDNPSYDRIYAILRDNFRNVAFDKMPDVVIVDRNTTSSTVDPQPEWPISDYQIPDKWYKQLTLALGTRFELDREAYSFYYDSSANFWWTRFIVYPGPDWDTRDNFGVELGEELWGLMMKVLKKLPGRRYLSDEFRVDPTDISYRGREGLEIYGYFYPQRY